MRQALLLALPQVMLQVVPQLTLLRARPVLPQRLAPGPPESFAPWAALLRPVRAWVPGQAQEPVQEKVWPQPKPRAARRAARALESAPAQPLPRSPSGTMRLRAPRPVIGHCRVCYV
jgi:hypothetical protein